ncbi:MAG: TonB-dependent siderophore receptor [Caulobacter sp.]
MRTNTASGVTTRVKRALGAAAVAGAAGLSLAPGLALAADVDRAITASEVDAATPVQAVDVYGARPNRPSSTKATAAPLDTPQTVTVVSDRTIRDQNLLTLRDILQTVPGITFGAGEGGGGYGDSINLRGYSANNDVTTDGLRDSAQYSRTDPFNLQQIEVINGANSVYAGAGSVGGSINLVSKAPRIADTTLVSVGAGTDGYGRFTLDANRMLGESVAVRLNMMAHGNDAPGRDVERFSRWGVAPAITFGIDGPTRVTLAWFHQEDDNVPQYGVPYASNAFLNGPLPGVDPSSYYGYRNIDTQEIGVDSLTLRIVHEFSDSLTLTSTARWQQVTQLTVVDPPQGAWCLASGFNAQTGAACGAPGVYTLSGPRGNLRDTTNTQLVSQTDFNWKFATGGWAHNLVLGVSLSNETYDLTTGRLFFNDNGSAVVLPTMSIANPDNRYAGPVNFLTSAISDGELANQAVYVFDTVELNDHWRFNGGLRVERNEGEFVSTPYTWAVGTPPTRIAGVTTIARNEETLVSWRVGLVYKPVENASLYIAYGNTRTPSQATVNGGCSTTGVNQNCNVEPEEGEVLELGAKWDAFDGRLSLTGALFQNERTNIRLNSNDPAIPVQQLDGASRVRGATLGVAGRLTDRWTVLANYTWLDSEILQNIASTALPPNNVDYTRGDPIPMTPEHAFNLWNTFMVTDRVMVGYGATYSGDYAFARAGASSPLLFSDPYWLHNAAVTWTVNDDVSLQLNVKNLTDEEYYTRIRSSSGFGWATPGDARSAQVSLNYRF